MQFEVDESDRADANGGDRPEPVADLLSDPYCRHLLARLRRADGPVDLATLATDVAARAAGVPPEAVDPAVQRRVQTWLHHGQLPTLVERGVVEYDPEAGRVRLLRDVDV